MNECAFVEATRGAFEIILRYCQHEKTNFSDALLPRRVAVRDALLSSVTTKS